MEVETEKLFLILHDNFNWINKHGDEFLKKMKTFYMALPDDNQMKAKVITQLQSIEIIPDAAKDFKITKTHQTITSYFMSQVFNGYQNSIVYYVDDIIPTYVSFMQEHDILDETTIESIYKLELNDEQKFKMELFLRSSRLIFISGQAHAYVLNSILTYIRDIYFRNTDKLQDKKKSSEDVKNSSEENIKISEEKPNEVQNEEENPELKDEGKPNGEASKNEYMDEIQFQLFIENFLKRNSFFFDYVMVLELAGDNLKMDLFEHIEELDIKIFRYVYDFIYLDDKPTEKNKQILDMLKREEIIEILHLIKLPISMDEPDQMMVDRM